jgi:hypothetical protein
VENPAAKKREPRERLFESLNREASNRVDRSHSNPDDWMRKLSAVKLKEWLIEPRQVSEPCPAKLGAMYRNGIELNA